MYAARVEMWRHNLSAKDVDITSAKTVWVWLLLVTFVRIRMELLNLISFVVFPTLPLLQTILSFLHSWIQKLILNITGIFIPYKVNDNHVIVICHCYMSLLFQWCQTVVLLSVDTYFNLTIKGLKTSISYNHFHVGVIFDPRWPSTF
jgi:hypothetical protein